MIISMLRSDSGSVATMTGVLFTVIAGAAGAALDYTKASNWRTELHSVADASVLAAAAAIDATDDERMTVAKDTFLGSYFCEANGCAEPTVSMDGAAVVLETEEHLKTMMMSLVGFDNLTVAVHSKAIPASATPVDVMMMLDFSGSMSSSNKFQDMADAATSFLDQADALPGDHISVGLVPFSKYVLAPLDGSYVYDMTAGSVLTGQNIVGCMLNREYSYAASSATPISSQIGSLWPTTSYAVGINPEGGGFTDDYSSAFGEPTDIQFSLDDSDYTLRYIDIDPRSGASAPTVSIDDDEATITGGGEFMATMVGATSTNITFDGILAWGSVSPSPYGGYAGSDGWTTGIDGGLPDTFDTHQLSEQLNVECGQYVNRRLWARPLSQDFTGMKLAVGAMQPAGLTNISLAVDFGWHMLTNAAPFTEASPETDAKKIAILLTDGVQTVEANGPDISGLGTELSRMAANAVTAESCTAMKAEGIEIFTIAFDIEDDFTRDLLRDCASGDPQYFEPAQGGELDTIFNNIFQKIARDRVRLTG